MAALSVNDHSTMDVEKNSSVVKIESQEQNAGSAKTRKKWSIRDADGDNLQKGYK